MTKVWVVGGDELAYIAEHEPLKVFEEKNDALNYYNSRHVSEVSIVEAELIYIVPDAFPLRISNYMCVKCGELRPNYFELCFKDNLFNIEKIWCDNCQEDTKYKNVANIKT